MRRRRASAGIRGLLLAVNAFALFVPIAAIVLLRIFDDQLIRRTEAQLIGESVLIAEAWREAWLREQQIDPAPRAALDAARSGRSALLPDRADPAPRPGRAAADARRRRARPPPCARDRRGAPAARVEPMLRRAVRMNLSSARVLDAQGCVVASSGAQRGACLGELAEVRAALAGPTPPCCATGSATSRLRAWRASAAAARVRVYTALPVLADGAVIGVVRMSRTGDRPGKALWFDRYRLLAVLFGCSLLTAGRLALPLANALAPAARDHARGAGASRAAARVRPSTLPGLAPAELRELSRALDQMISQLSDRAEYISEFATTVSHELKTPITAIRGASELLSSSGAR